VRAFSPIAARGADQASLKLAGKTLHHRDTETRRHGEDLENRLAGQERAPRLPLGFEITEVAEATEKRLTGPVVSGEPIAARGADQASLKLAGKTLHHRATETRRHGEDLENRLAGQERAPRLPLGFEITEVAEGTEKKTLGACSFWRAGCRVEARSMGACPGAVAETESKRSARQIETGIRCAGTYASCRLPR
jgi:hypothetical protein